MLCTTRYDRQCKPRKRPDLSAFYLQVADNEAFANFHDFHNMMPLPVNNLSASGLLPVHDLRISVE
jgi:hypothetical protein